MFDPKSEAIGHRLAGMASLPWAVESARVSSFLSAGASEPKDLWKELVGDDPSENVDRIAQRQRVSSGAFAGGILTITEAAQKTDIVLTPAPPNEATQAMPNLGNPANALPHFIDLFSQYSEIGAGSVRLAFGLSLITDDDIDQKLQNLVPNLDIKSSIPDDFILQINRRIKIDSIGYLVNRLTKWSIPSYQLISINPATGRSSVVLSESYFRVDFDINTDAARSEQIAADLRGPVLSELITGALDIAISGDPR